MPLPFEMNLFWSLVLVPVGLALLLKGAGILVDASASLAERFGVSPLIVGLTVVALGTSAPEIATSITAARAGWPNTAIGNVFGSNIANLSLVAGFSVLFGPMMVKRSVIRREMPVMLGIAVLLWVLLNDMVFGHTEGSLLLMLFAGLLVVSIYLELQRTKRCEDGGDVEVTEHAHKVARHSAGSVFTNCGLILIGLVMLAVGSDISVQGAVYIGARAGLSEAVIGLTIIAVGTSLPELMTCVVAAIKKQHEISVGTLIGSNIFNALLALGCVGVFWRGEDAIAVDPALMRVDFFVMVGVSVVFFMVAGLAKQINRRCGVVLLLGYAAYVTYLLAFTRVG